MLVHLKTKHNLHYLALCFVLLQTFCDGWYWLKTYSDGIKQVLNRSGYDSKFIFCFGGHIKTTDCVCLSWTLKVENTMPNQKQIIYTQKKKKKKKKKKEGKEEEYWRDSTIDNLFCNH